jgi:hypothetical protein
MDLDSNISIILTNCMELVFDNLFSMLQIIILSARSIINGVAPEVLLFSKSIQDDAPHWQYFNRFQSE